MRSMKNRHAKNGFTLLETMIALVVWPWAFWV